MTPYETYWQDIELVPDHQPPQLQSYTVPAAAPRILHQIADPFLSTHQVVAAQRRRCAVGEAVRLFLEPRLDPGEPVALHIWRMRIPLAT